MCDSVLLAKGCFNALKEPLPQSRHRVPEHDQGAGDGQVRLDRRPERRGRQAGQPRVLGLRGVIDRTRPLWIVGDFGGELGQDDVADPKIVGGGARGPYRSSRRVADPPPS